MIEILAIGAFIALMIGLLPTWSYSERWGYIPVFGLMIVATAAILSQLYFGPV